MNKIKLFIAGVAALVAGSASAQKLTANNVTIEAGGDANLTISIDTPDKGRTAEFTLVLPEGISVAKDEDGDYEFSKGEVLPNKFENPKVSESDAGVKVLIFDTNTNPVRTFSAASGTLIILPLVADETLIAGELTAKLTGIVLGDANSKSFGDVSDVTINITVTPSTGIGTITRDMLNRGEVYDLKGNKVSTVKKGVYLVNGKKVVVK